MFTESVEKLASILKNGGIVIFPTETVYGIGALATNTDACLKIYSIKNRPSDNPLIVHFADKSEIEKYCEVSAIAKVLLDEFSPGPLTLVLKKKSDSLFSCGLSTVAVRIPDHAEARKLISLSGPIAAPSANPSGKPSYTKMEDVLEEFSGKVDGFLKATEPSYSMESTVLDLSQGKVSLLRTGSIDRRMIETRLGIQVKVHESSEIISPGMKYRHYAPNGKIFISKILPSVQAIQSKHYIVSNHLENSMDKSIPKIARIGFTMSDISNFDKIVFHNLEYMKSLYKFLLDCDKANIEIIYCQEPKDGEHADTIWDRLRKASSA
ncbi:MAG: threonylcarbamoyl-AMP synthase [Leptospiraceae bacterium]|nr:threonylcarbamoyl-AMP synthase [Leptospiraceae bacterium]